MLLVLLLLALLLLATRYPFETKGTPMYRSRLALMLATAAAAIGCAPPQGELLTVARAPHAAAPSVFWGGYGDPMPNVFLFGRSPFGRGGGKTRAARRRGRMLRRRGRR